MAEITARYPTTLPEEDPSVEDEDDGPERSERVYRAVSDGRSSNRSVGFEETDSLDEHVTREAALYVQGQSDGIAFRNALIASRQRRGLSLPRWTPAPDPRRPLLWAFVISLTFTVIHVAVLVALGAVTVFCARLVRVAIIEAIAPYYEINLMLGSIHFGILIDFVLALGIGKVIGDLSGGNLTYAGRYRMIGVYAVFTLMHNLVWWYPDQMRMLYSDEWVDEIEQVSDPNSVFVFVRSIPFEQVAAFLGDPPGQAREGSLPRIIGSGGSGESRFVGSNDRDRTTGGFVRDLDLRRNQ